MLLSDFSIRRPVSTVVIIIGLMCLGLLALNKLRVNQIPDVEQPVMVVTVPYPGASPETVEREIINRVEKSLQSIPQVYQIRSTSQESSATIVIIFNFKKNMAEAADEIRPGVELLGEDVVHSPVRVVDDDLVGTARRRPLDRGVDVRGHEVSEPLVLGLALHELVAARDAADSFTVGGDEDLHACPLIPSLGSRARRV